MRTGSISFQTYQHISTLAYRHRTDTAILIIVIYLTDIIRLYIILMQLYAVRSSNFEVLEEEQFLKNNNLKQNLSPFDLNSS